MKAKTTPIISILALTIALFCIGQLAKAQVAAPPVTPANQTIYIEVPSLGTCDVAIEGGNIIVSNYDPYRLFDDNSTVVSKNSSDVFSCLTPKKGHPNEFWALVNGELYLYTVTSPYSDNIQITKTESLYTFTIGSDGYLQIEGDALYINDANIMGVSRDTGVTWTIDSAGLGYMSWFSMDTAQNVWAVGQSNGFLYYQNADTTNVWHKVSTFPNGVSPRNIFIDRLNRFFVGTNGNGVYYSYDKGHTWIQGVTGISGVACGNMNDDAFGNIYLLNSIGLNIYRSVNGGGTWTEPPGDTEITNRSSFLSNAFNLINCISGDSALAAATQFGVYYSKDSGKNWIQNDTGLQEGTLNGFWKFSNGRLLETSSNGVFWLNKGDSVWHKPLPTNGYGSAGIIYADTIGNTYVNGIYSSSDAATYKSSDNGNSWTSDTLGIYLVNGHWWVDQYGNEHNSYYNGSITSVYKKTGNNPYVLDTAGIGIISSSPNYGVGSVASDGAGYLYMSGKWDPVPDILRRPILGGTWSADTAGSHGIYFNAMAHDINHKIIGSPLWEFSGLYYLNAGRWYSMPYPSAIPSYDNVTAIACDSSGGTLAAFDTYDFTLNNDIGLGVYCTHDYGTTWNYVGLDSLYVNQLVNCGGDTTYALTAGQGVYKLVCSGVITSVPSTKSISKLESSVSLYPNPNNGNFTLEYNLPNSTAELKIFDITGKIVYSSKITNQDGKQTINASGLNSGVYFWQVFSEDKLIDKGKIAVVK